ITLGSIPGLENGWRLESVVDQVTGQIGIALYSTTPITSSQAGSLVNMTFNILPGALVPTTAAELANAATLNGHFFSTQVADSEGLFVLSPGLNRLVIRW